MLFNYFIQINPYSYLLHTPHLRCGSSSFLQSPSQAPLHVRQACFLATAVSQHAAAAAASLPISFRHSELNIRDNLHFTSIRTYSPHLLFWDFSVRPSSSRSLKKSLQYSFKKFPFPAIHIYVYCFSSPYIFPRWQVSYVIKLHVCEP